ncbi:MAG: DinB family protein [Edaphobacter sp.]
MNPTLNQLQREIASSLQGLSAEQTQLRPTTPGKWSIQQIIEHLLLTYTGAETALNARLTKGRPTQAKPTALQRMQQLAVCKFGYLPQGRIAPDMVTPGPTVHPLSGEELTAATEDHLAHFDLLCSECESLFGTSQFATHNALGPLSVEQWCRFQLMHGRHHLKQIAAIRRTHNL